VFRRNHCYGEAVYHYPPGAAAETSQELRKRVEGQKHDKIIKYVKIESRREGYPDGD
jgi:hypothetical protein